MKTLMMISLALVGCSNNQVPEEAKPLAKAVDPVERGKHLVITSGCHDCHTPFKLGPKGAEPDFSRALSGHPAALVMPPAPELPPGPWLMSVAATNTAWAGPWGVSFTANLTPDKETGLGTWSEATFVATIRNAKHQGVGRPLLPPMPAAFLAQMPDEDLGAIYAYLRTVPAIKNQVPTPVPPKGAAAASAGAEPAAPKGAAAASAGAEPAAPRGALAGPTPAGPKGAAASAGPAPATPKNAAGTPTASSPMTLGPQGGATAAPTRLPKGGAKAPTASSRGEATESPSTRIARQ